MLKIYGANLSAPANKVRMTANALGLDYEYVQINIRAGDHKKPGYLIIHPAGKVPAIDDNGFILFESDAIIKYLAVSNSSPLYPENLMQRALTDQWIDFTTIHVGGAMGRVLFNRVFAAMAKVAPDERSLADGVKFLDRFLPVINDQLGKFEFLSGDRFSLADINLLATVDPAEVAEINISAYPNLVKWREKLVKKDFYTKCHASYAQALKAMMAGSA